MRGVGGSSAAALSMGSLALERRVKADIGRSKLPKLSIGVPLVHAKNGYEVIEQRQELGAGSPGLF